MPCTEGGTPVTIDRLLGLVKLGITQSAMKHVAGAGEQPAEKGRGAGRHRGRDVLVLAAVDADDDQRTVHPAVGSAVDGDVGWQIATPVIAARPPCAFGRGSSRHVGAATDPRARVSRCAMARTTALCSVLDTANPPPSCSPRRRNSSKPLGQQPVAFRQPRIAGKVDQHVVKLQIQGMVGLDVLPVGRLRPFP